MRVKKIEYPTNLSQTNVENDNIDVFAELEDGVTYTVVVSTPNNFYEYMSREKVDYYCGVPDIIVKMLTKDNIERAIEKYAEDDAYWLKYYHLASEISIDTMNKVIEEKELINKDIFDSQ